MIKKIQKIFPELRESEKKVANLVLDNPNVFIDGNNVEIAEMLNISTTSVIRFCQKLGYKGTKQFKSDLAKYMIFNHRNEEIVDVQIDKNTPMTEYPAILCKLGMDILSRTEDCVDHNDINNAAEAILNARNIYIYGVGNSTAIVDDLYNRLVRLGLNAHNISDSHLQIITATTMEPCDLAIGISRSGHTKDIVEALSIAKSNGATTIGITNLNGIPLLNASDIKLITPQIESTFESETTVSRFSMFVYIDIIYMAIFYKNYNTNKQIVEKLNKNLKDKSI